MPNLPMLLTLADEMDRLSNTISPFYMEPATMRYRWPKQLQRLTKEIAPVSPIGKDGFQVCMDVAQFKPSELAVKVVDNSVVVEGKHEEREDEHGYIQRHFVRRYTLPKGYEAEKVMSTLSSDGVLTVSVPKPPAIQNKGNERVIPIQQTGPAHLNIKDNRKEDKETSTPGPKEKRSKK